jgi:ABC-type branched-subunit amino acid transport system permease subunit
MVQRVRASVVAAPTSSLINVVGVIVVAYVAVVAAQRIYQGGPIFFAQTMGFGLALGAIYALVALGYTMVYGIIELINFAHGDVFTLGAFFSLALMPAFGLTEGKFGIGIILPLLGLFVVTMLLCAVVNVTGCPPSWKVSCSSGRAPSTCTIRTFCPRRRSPSLRESPSQPKRSW